MAASRRGEEGKRGCAYLLEGEELFREVPGYIEHAVQRLADVWVLNILTHLSWLSRHFKSV